MIRASRLSYDPSYMAARTVRVAQSSVSPIRTPRSSRILCRRRASATDQRRRARTRVSTDSSLWRLHGGPSFDPLCGPSPVPACSPQLGGDRNPRVSLKGRAIREARYSAPHADRVWRNPISARALPSPTSAGSTTNERRHSLISRSRARTAPRVSLRGREPLGCRRRPTNQGWKPIGSRLDSAIAAYLARKQAERHTRMGAVRCLKRHLARRIRHLMTTTTDTQSFPLFAGTT
jgi:hypothetical protein